MPLIALEEHMLPADLARTAKAKHADVPRMRDALDEVGEQRLAAMDAAGIDIQVLSIGAPGAAALPPEASVPMARQLNDRVAAAVTAHPDRFRAMATLPTPDPDAAVAEAYRAVRELGFCGVMINGHTNGEFLDEPRYDQILGAVAELGVPLYLHPTFPPQAVRDAYFHGFDAVTSRTLYTGGWGWHAETGLHVLRMAVGGVFDRYPDLQVVIGHMGENLPFSLMRADSRLALERPDLPSVAETILSHVHLTISGYTTVPPLQCALAVFGADRIMFAVDYPWSDCVETAEFLAAAPLSPTDREKIAHLNAEQLYKL